MHKFFQKLFRIYFLCVGFNLMKNTCTTDTDKNKDAKTIVDSKFNPKTITDILLYRTAEECYAINTAVAPLNGGKNLVDPKYVPLANTTPYQDLLFALVNEPMTVFSMYLGQYMDRKDETFIIMIYIQIDDREKFKDVYKSQHDHCFDDAREKQRKPFKNAFRVWSEKNRDPTKTDCISDTCVVGQNLQDEQTHWNKKSRDQLEYVLMKESFEDSRSSIHCYGTLYGDQPKADFIKDITTGIKNHDLVDLYTSLVRYVQNGDVYLAQVLHDYCNDNLNNWSMWIIILTTRRGEAMNKIDEAFKGQYNVTLKDHIKTCNIQDAQFKDMLTVLVDSSSEPKRQTPPPPSADDSEPQYIPPALSSDDDSESKHKISPPSPSDEDD